ncbi:MAG: DUF1492 domain-containing protein [Gemmiger sp.]
MDYKDKIAWLRRYQDSLRQEKRLRNAIRRERARLESTNAALNGMPHSGRDADKIGRGVSLLLDYQQELAAQLVESKQLRREIEAAIDQLANTTQRDALRGRYVDGLEWWRVANQMYISERWAKSLHKAAIENLKIDPSSSLLPALK